MSTRVTVGVELIEEFTAVCCYGSEVRRVVRSCMGGEVVEEVIYSWVLRGHDGVRFFLQAEMAEEIIRVRGGS